jgi:hypothetical protein
VLNWFRKGDFKIHLNVSDDQWLEFHRPGVPFWKMDFLLYRIRRGKVITFINFKNGTVHTVNTKRVVDIKITQIN